MNHYNNNIASVSVEIYMYPIHKYPVDKYALWGLLLFTMGRYVCMTWSELDKQFCSKKLRFSKENRVKFDWTRYKIAFTTSLQETNCSPLSLCPFTTTNQLMLFFGNKFW